MDEVKNILVLNPFPTFPIEQGSSRRTWNLLNEIKANNYNIHMVYYAAYKYNKNNLKMLQPNFDTVTIIEKNNEYYPQKGKNNPLDNLYENGLGEKISELCKLLSVDIVLCNYIFQSKVFEFLPKDIIKIIDTHDVFTDKYKFENWHSFSKEDEAKALNRANLIISIQSNEEKYFKSISNTNVITINHLENPQFLEKKYNKLKIIGILSSGHKQDLIAIQQFVRAFKKFIKKGYTGIELHIAGKVCDKLSEAEVNIPEVKCLGLVKDLKEFYNSIDLICSIPINGTGLKIKTVEAMSYGIPLVSTKCGSDGINTNLKSHNCLDINSALKEIEQIIIGTITLDELANQSKRIFLQYLKENKQRLNNIFPPNNSEKNTLYTTICKLYNQLEMSNARDGFSVGHTNNDAMDNLFNLIEKLSQTQFFKTPFKKYDLYKRMLDVFYSNK